jgi:hypothetical protein
MDKMDKFFAKMKEDCKNGILENTFNPYVDWLLDKISRNDISKAKMWEMCEFASERMEQLNIEYPNAFNNLPTHIDENPWQMYEGFGKDKYLYSYYAHIESDLTNMIMLA